MIVLLSLKYYSMHGDIIMIYNMVWIYVLQDSKLLYTSFEMYSKLFPSYSNLLEISPW